MKKIIHSCILLFTTTSVFSQIQISDTMAVSHHKVETYAKDIINLLDKNIFLNIKTDKTIYDYDYYRTFKSIIHFYNTRFKTDIFDRFKILNQAEINYTRIYNDSINKISDTCAISLEIIEFCFDSKIDFQKAYNAILKITHNKYICETMLPSVVGMFHKGNNLIFITCLAYYDNKEVKRTFALMKKYYNTIDILDW